MRIAFFGTKEYDKKYFNEFNKEHEIKYFRPKLSEETAILAKGYEAVCAFVNDDLSGDVVEILGTIGVKYILLRCAGFNNVDLNKTKEYGITVARVPSYSPEAVAEHAMSILMTANRRIHKAYNKVRDNDYSLLGLGGVNLCGKTAGIIGTGKIGAAMARICKGFGMDLIAYDPFPNENLVNELGIKYVSLDYLLTSADMISLHSPLTEETKYMINDDTIAKMKNGVMLVNTSRGGLINTEDLIEGIKANKFHCVALDVYEEENGLVFDDYSDAILEHTTTARLLSFPNVILTSHQGFFTEEALDAIAQTTLYNASKLEKGERCENIVE